MPAEIARRGLDMFAPPSGINVSFFGGEPLLAWDVIQEAVSYGEHLARQRGSRAKFHITTNGTLLNVDKARFVKQHGISLLVSLDGHRQIHDHWRPFRSTDYADYTDYAERSLNGKRESAPSAKPADDLPSSFDATMNALHALREAGQRPPMARATFATSRPQLLERLVFFDELRRKGIISGVSIEPAVLTEGCARTCETPEDFDFEALGREYHEVAEWFLEQLNAGNRPKFFHYEKTLSRLVHKKLAPAECGAGRGYLTIGPQGGIFACHRENHTGIGHLDTGIDEELRAPWLDNRYYLRRACRVCWARHVCGGGCRQAHLETAGSMYKTNARLCRLKRLMFKECLWIMVKADPQRLKEHIRP